MDWHVLRAIPLTATRLELHGAALAMGSVADSILEAQPDDSQSNLGVQPGAGGFATRLLPSGGGDTQVTLDGPEQRLVWWRGGRPHDGLELAGRTMRDTLDWAQRCARESSGREVEIAMRRYPDMPPIGTLSGGVFQQAEPAALRVFFDWYANAETLFSTLRGRMPALSASRVWPHHFDLGALLPLLPTDRDGDGGEEASVGLGLSPGDGLCPDPYFYCSPYPQPGPASQLPELPAGAWHRGAFTTAWLRASELLAADDQRALAERYLHGALEACRAILR